MKKVLLVFLLSLISFSIQLSAQKTHSTMQWQNHTREYLVYVPSDYDADHAYPVIFALHGLMMNIDMMDPAANISGFVQQAHWICVVPQALPYSATFNGATISTGNTWNSGMRFVVGGQEYTPNADIDDSGFLMALLDTIENHYNINADSVFFSGISMGGFMTHRMAIEHADRIAGAAPVSGTIALPLSSLTPVAPIDILHIHGTADPVVDYNGVAHLGNGALPDIPAGLGVDQTIAYWRSANQCSAASTVDTLPDRRNDGLLFERSVYGGGVEGSRVALLKVIGGVHTWYGDDSLYDVDYLKEIYHFFTGNELPTTPVGMPAVVTSGTASCEIYPNPVSTITNITLKGIQGNITIAIMDMSGRQVLQRHLSCSTEYTFRLNVHDFAKGVYFVRVTGDNINTVRKMIVK